MSSVGAGLRTPLDPTLGEVPEAQRRVAVRQIADVVGKKVARKVQEAQAQGQALSGDAEKVSSVTEIHAELAQFNEARVRKGSPPLSDFAHTAMVEAVMAHIYGLGELDVLWGTDDVENIDVNGPDKVFVTFVGGEKVQWAPIARDQDELVDLIRRAARQLGANEVEFDARHPQLDLQLPDGSRLFAVFGGDSGNGIATAPTLCIRRHRHLEVRVADLVRLGVLPQHAAEFVVAAFRAGENLIVAGDHNAGKTTFLVLCTRARCEHRSGRRAKLANDRLMCMRTRAPRTGTSGRCPTSICPRGRGHGQRGPTRPEPSLCRDRRAPCSHACLL